MPVIIPPWTEPPNFLAAAEAGARIGQQQSQFAADQLLKQQELGATTGLGYARLNTEAAQAAAAQKEAAAKLALEQSRYSDLNNLGQQRIGLGQEKINETAQQNEAANALRQKNLAMKQQFGETASDQKDRELAIKQLSADFQASGMKREDADQRGAQIEKDGAMAMLDPGWSENPNAVIASGKYPLAGQSKLVHINLQNRNLEQRDADKPAPAATVTGFSHGAKVEVHPPSESAAGMLTNLPAGAFSRPGVPPAPGTAPVQKSNPPPPGKGMKEVQNGVLYNWNGFKYVPAQ